MQATGLEILLNRKRYREQDGHIGIPLEEFFKRRTL